MIIHDPKDDVKSVLDLAGISRLCADLRRFLLRPLWEQLSPGRGAAEIWGGSRVGPTAAGVDGSEAYTS